VDYYDCNGNKIASCLGNTCDPASFDESDYPFVISSSIEEMALPLTAPECPCMDSSREIEDQIICFGQSFEINNTIYNSSQLVTETFQTPEGCDSTVIFELIVLEEDITQIEETLCEGETYTFDNQVFDSRGVYPIEYTSVNGCDSIIEINLDFFNSFESEFDTLLCQGEKYIFNNVEFDIDYTEETFVFSDVNGCDSLHTVRIEYEPLNSENCNPEINFVESSSELVITPLEGVEFDGIDENTESITIFGRWGNKIFEVNNPTEDFKWFGRKNNGTMLPEGTYYFIIIQNGSTSSNPNPLRKGFITLLN